MTSMIGTRHFVQDNQCLKTNDPILIRDDKVMNILSLVFNGEPCYRFSIFHLHFVVTYSGVICVKSSLPEDKLQDFTNLATLNKGTLHYVLLILTENILVMKANAYNDKVFNKVENLILGFLDSVKDKINYKPCIMAPFFQIGTCDVGLVFKQVSISESSTVTVGRPIVTMGQFNVALLGHIHDTLVMHNISKKEQQKGFITCYRFSGFIDGGSMMDKSYQECLADLKNMDIPQIRRLIQTFMMPYCKDEHVCGSLLEYAVEHRTGRRPTVADNQHIKQNNFTESPLQNSEGDFDGNTIISTPQGISMLTSINNLKEVRNMNLLLLSHKWNLASIYHTSGKVLATEKASIRLIEIIDAIKKDDQFFTMTKEIDPRSTTRLDFVKKNIDIYREIGGINILVYFKGKHIMTFLDLESLLRWLADVNNYVQLFKNEHEQEQKKEQIPFNDLLMQKVSNELDSHKWEQYSNSNHDKGVKKSVSVMRLLNCLAITAEVSRVLQTQSNTLEEVYKFFHHQLVISKRDNGAMVVSYRLNSRMIPMAYFPMWCSLLEWFTKIDHYVFIHNTIKNAEQTAAIAVVDFPSTSSSQVGMPQQDSIQKNVSLTEAFLEKEIPQLSDNFTLRIDFDQFLKQTQRHEYVYHKLNQERLILKDKSFPSIYRTPSFLRIVLSDNSQLDTEKNKTIVTKLCVVEFVYNESTVTKKAVLDFRMFKFNEYKRNDFVAALARYLEITDSVINSIVSHWKYIDNKQESSKEEKIAKVKEAIWKYLDTRCFQSKLVVGQPPKVTEVEDTYLFDPAKFVEYFNGVSHHGFKLSDVPSATIEIIAESVATKNPLYIICHQSVRGQPFAFDNHRKAAEHLLQYVKF